MVFLPDPQVEVRSKGKPSEEGTMTKHRPLDFAAQIQMKEKGSPPSYEGLKLSAQPPKADLCDPFRVPPGGHGNLKLPGAACENPCFIGGL